MSAVPFPTRTDGLVFRQATPDDFDAMIARDEQAFGEAFAPEQRERVRQRFVFERFVVALDGDDLVGLAGSYDFDLTLPGGATVPTAGTTWVSVAPTHRRRGITRDMLGWIHADAVERGCVAAELLASEGSIYERFGYGVATRCRVVRLDARRAGIGGGRGGGDGDVRLVDPSSSVDEMHERYDRARRTRVGELSRSRDWIADHLAQVKNPHLALHDDGYVMWRVDADWTPEGANHTLRVVDLVAATPEAHRALWALVTSIDLIARIEARTAVSVDDALPWQFDDPRTVSTTTLSDYLWMRPLDLAALFSARRYRVTDEFVIEVTGEAERWRVSGGPNAATCEATRVDATVTATRAALGSLLLGGVSATELSAGGRLQADPTALGRLDAFFGWSPAPHCTTDF